MLSHQCPSHPVGSWSESCRLPPHGLIDGLALPPKTPTPLDRVMHVHSNTHSHINMYTCTEDNAFMCSMHANVHKSVANTNKRNVDTVIILSSELVFNSENLCDIGEIIYLV